MRGTAIAALPIAIGAAIQVSGFGGTLAVLIAWGTVAVVLLTLAAHLLWRRRLSAAEDAACRTRKLGHELVSFAQTRRVVAPLPQPPPSSAQRILSAFRNNGDPAGRELAYDTDTMSLYVERFADRVVAVIHTLRGNGRIAAAEAQAIIVPACPAEIESLGHRLIELGYPEE